MPGRITIPEEEWERIKKDVELLKKQNKMQEKQQHTTTIRENELTEYERKVLEYIHRNPNVNKQHVVNHFDKEVSLEERMSRQLVYKTIDSLVNQGIINDKKDPKNRQIHRLTINQNSILYSVIQELDQFEKVFRHLSHRALEKADEYGSNSQEFFEIVSHPYLIFFRVVDSYIIRSTLVWARTIQDKDMLKKLNTIVFAKIADMQQYLPEVVVEGRDFIKEMFIFYKLNGIVHLQEYFCFFEKFALKEVKPVIDAIWDINREIQGYAYPEPRMFDWDFKYGVDGWEKLLALRKQHPEDTILNDDKMTTDAILNRKE